MSGKRNLELKQQRKSPLEPRHLPAGLYPASNRRGSEVSVTEPRRPVSSGYSPRKLQYQDSIRMAAVTSAAEASIPSGSGDNYVWADVSPLLEDACNGLSSLPLCPMLENGRRITGGQKLLMLGSADFQLLFLDTGLQDGELIHGDNFNLYAAMSALEVLLLLLLWMVLLLFLFVFTSNLHCFFLGRCHHLFRVLQ